MEIIPKSGLKGLRENWQSDLLAAVSVALVALPLALGIAIASGVPPMAGIFSAIIGGVVTTFFRGGHISINGPGAGLIAILLGSAVALNDGSGQTLNYVLAAIVVSGAVQILMGLLKLGRFADVIHSSVIRGILAALGIIIVAKQIHVALGSTPSSEVIIENLVDVVKQADTINPFVAILSILGLLLLIFQSKISYKLFHFLPAPMWVLVLSIPFVYLFNYFETHDLIFMGKSHEVGPYLLVDVPENFMDALAYPNFAKFWTLPFWSSVLSITMISSIESLASAKAVDKLDPYQRKTNLNKDLVGLGISTMVSGALGGLPIITVIVRSTVNIHNHAKTKWSNFFHGILLAVFVLILSPVIQLVPLSALATILVFTGFKLASPKVFQQVYDRGIEQLIFFIGTLLITLFTNLLIGLMGGMLLALAGHFLIARIPLPLFLRMLFKPGTKLIQKEDGSYLLKIKGIANFLTTLKTDKLLSEIPEGSTVKIDFSTARLVGSSMLESISDFERTHTNAGGKVEIRGLSKHISTSNHRLALKKLSTPQSSITTRQVWLRKLAESKGWIFSNETSYDTSYLQSFYFFKPRPIVEKSTRIYGRDNGISWEITDVVFDEGAYLSFEEFKTTLAILKLPYHIPKFTIEKKGGLTLILDLSEHKDIDYVIYHEFSNRFSVKCEDIDDMRDFCTPEFQQLIEESNIHHLESNGEAILVFSDHMKLAKIHEYSKMIKFIEDLRMSFHESLVTD